MATVAKASERAAESQSVQKIASSVVSFLAKTVAASPCYPSLCEFGGIFTRAMPLAGEFLEPQKRAECLLIEKLAAIGADSNATLSSDGVSVFVSRPFFAGGCYHSFVAHRAKKILAVAKAETSNPRRLEMLATLSGMSSSLAP